MNTYMVVTNDEYELPVNVGVVGIKNVEKIVGLSAPHIYKCMREDCWSAKCKYKVVHEETNVKHSSTNKYHKLYMRKYCRRNKEKIREYQRDYQQQRKKARIQSFIRSE